VETIEQILLTHLHGDHSGGIAEIHRRFGSVPVAALPFPDSAIDDLRAAGAPEIADYLADFQSKAWFRALEDGQVVTTQGATLTVRHTPGHTIEHVVFFLREDKALFTGDNVLGHGSTFAANLTEYMHSLQLMAAFASNEPSHEPLRLYPSHGPMVTDGVRWISAYKSHREVREQKVVEVLRGASWPMSVEDIVREMYPKFVSEEAKGQAFDNVIKVLRMLLDRGTAACHVPSGSDVPSKPLNRYTWQEHHNASLWRWCGQSKL